MRKALFPMDSAFSFRRMQRRTAGAAWFFPLKWLHPPEFVQI